MMTRAFSFLVLLTVVNISNATTLIWNNPNGGNWSDTNNWTYVDDSSSEVTTIITNAGTFTVTMDINATVNGAVFGGADSSLTLNVAAGVTMNLVASESVSFANLHFVNYGTVDWGDYVLGNHDISGSNAQVDNYGLWTAQTNAAMTGLIFNNYGTFQKAGGPWDSSATYLDASTIFINYGIVDIETGALDIGNGYGGGTFNQAANTTLILGSLYTLAGSVTFSGDGSIDGQMACSNAIISGTENLNGVTLSGSLTLAAGNVMNLVPAQGGTQFSNLSLTNLGTVNWTVGDFTTADSSPSQIENDGLWDTQTNTTMSGVAFDNYGTFRKSGVPLDPFFLTTLDSSTVFNNYSAVVDVESGYLLINNGNGDGIFTNSADAGTIWIGTLSGDCTMAGDGMFRANATCANATFHGIQHFNFGNLAGTLTLASNNVFHIRGRGLTSFSSLVLTNYGIVQWNWEFGDSPTDYGISGTDAEVDNYGSWIDQSSASMYGSISFNNYGLWDSQTNNTISDLTFNNFGTFLKSGGSLSDTPNYGTLFDTSTFTNYGGTVDVESGFLWLHNGSGNGSFNVAANTIINPGLTLFGNVTFTGDGTVHGPLYGNNVVINGSENFDGSTMSGTITLATNNVLNLLGNVGLSFTDLALTNYGVVNWFDMSGGSSSISGSNAGVENYGTWDNKANIPVYSLLFNNHGTFRKSGGVYSDYPPQTDFDSASTFNNSGLVDIQTGELELDGGYSLANGSLNFGLDGANNGLLMLAGNAALTGALSVNLTNGFIPAVSNSITLIQYGSENGTFSPLKLPHISSSVTWQANYDASAFSLTVIPLEPPQLSSVTIQDGNSISFQWDAFSDQTYQLQWTTNLESPVWLDLGDSISNTNGVITSSDSLDYPQKFYRVTLSP